MMLAPPLSQPGVAIDMADGELSVFRDVFAAPESARTLQKLIDQSDWQQETLTLFGRTIAMPRLTTWYGDAPYTYSGIEHPARTWDPLVDGLRQKVESLTGQRFNTVLLNYYRDGRDSMSWHSDDEPELGLNPAIASLNLGATRRFRFRRKQDNTQTLAVALTDASLLLMAGPIQHHWQHALAKTKKILGPRVNLTFRQVRL